MDSDDVLKDAIELWDENTQINMASEGAAELILTISRYFRGRCNKNDIAEKVADVQIMIDQLKIIIGEEEVNQIQDQKLERTKNAVRKTKNDRH